MKTLLRLIRFTLPLWKEMLLAVLLSVVTITCAIGLMGTSAYLISYAALQPSIAYLQVAIVGVRFFGISRGVFRYLERLASHSVNLRLLAELRIWLYRKMERLVPAILLEQRSGDLLALLTADIDTLENLFVRIMAPPLTALLVTFGMVLFLGGFNPGLGWIYLAGALAGGVLLPIAVYFAGRQPGRDLIINRAEMNARLTPAVQSATEIMLFGIERKEIETIEAISTAFGKAQMRLARVNGFGSGTMTWVVNFTLMGVLAAAIPLVRNSEMDGVLLAVVTLMTAASFEAIQPMIFTTHFLEPVLTAGERIFSVADLVPAITEANPPAEMPDNTVLEVSQLSFQYPGSQQLALESISLSVPRGKKIAIVGPSGSGKSTLVNLLVRTWDYTQGSITLGGVELRILSSEDISAKIGLLAQSPVILTDTLRRNLLVGNPLATDDELCTALEQVELNAWFRTLPQELDTWLGERGAKMSGGERQRLALARMNLRNCPIQIYDEPTANLDIETERQVFQTIMSQAKGKSIIWVTHHLTGLEGMDEIVFLERGEIVERGTFIQLMARGGRFAQFIEIQNSWLD